MPDCTLLSITCTTSMADWVHGDLWLCPDGLLRRSRGWLGTLANASSRGVRKVVDPANRPTRTFSAAERLEITGADKRNWWIPWESIVEAKLGHGVLSHGLHLTLTDGRRVSLRWMTGEGGIDLLEERLRILLGPRLIAS
jgi:hypothetical protein